MKKRLAPAIMLIIYSAILVNVLVFKHMPVIRAGQMELNFGGTQEGEANLIPFKTILPYLLGEKGFLIAFINIAGNIALLVPIGFIVPFVYRGITWKKMLAIAAACGLAIEGMQALLHVGIFDIDDVILNGLGVMLGFWTFALGAKMNRTARVRYIIAATVVVVAACVFLGVMLYSDARRQPRLPQAGNRLTGRFDSAGVNNDSLPPAGLVNAANAKGETSQLPDPCGGTGGTGQIVSVGDHSITIKGHNGVEQLIKIGPRTKIKDAAGPLQEAGLKVGYRVTVVVGLEKEDEWLASAVMVCRGSR